MIIDWHSHIYTPEEAADDTRTWDGKTGPSWGARCPMVLENLLAAHQRSNIDISVVTNAAHYMRGKAPTKNCGGAALDRLRRRGAARPQGHALRLRHHPALRRPGLHQGDRARHPRSSASRACFIHSSHKGHYPDDDEARPFWELVQDLDVPVMIHPPHLGFGEERMNDYRLASSIGRPFDLCLALSRLIVRGILEDFPRLKIVASHGGGGICETISRMDYAYELQDEALLPRLLRADEDQARAEPLSEDACTSTPCATTRRRCRWCSTGSGRTTCSTAATRRRSPRSSRAPSSWSKDLRVSDEDREKIFWRNAAKLLKLDVARV